MDPPRPAPQLALDTCARRLRAYGEGWPEPGITWFGPAASLADGPGSEASVQAVCGLMAVHGRDAGAPRRLGLEVASVAAGLLAAQGALATAVARRRGQDAPALATSVLQAGLVLLSHYVVVATGLADAVPGPSLPAPGPPFRSADGRWFELETLDPDRWKEFWTRLGAADAELGRAWTVFRWRYERATCSLPAALQEATARRTLAELTTVAISTGVSVVPLRDYAEVLADREAGAGHPVLRSVGGGAAPLDQPLAPTPGLPLAGIRVVEATSRIQGPFAGMLLCMLGADVVRVEPPAGDYGRAPFTLHRGKATVTLDLGTAEGRAGVVDLVAGADVFLHNWRPGRAAAWGLGFDELAAASPDLVYAEASGWGDRTDTCGQLGTDFLVQAHAGVGQGVNPEGEPPFPARIILADLFGALVGAEAVLAGLYRREQRGGAWEVRSSLWAGAMALQAHVLDGIAAGKEDGRCNGRPVWGPLDRPVRSAEGWLAVAVDSDERSDRLCEACGVDPAGRSRAATEARAADVLGGGTADEWEHALSARGIPAVRVAEDLTDVAADARLSDLFEPVGDGGAVAPRSPWSVVP